MDICQTGLVHIGAFNVIQRGYQYIHAHTLAGHRTICEMHAHVHVSTTK